MKRNLLFLLVVFASSIVFAKTSVSILIDPGHGGKDPGHLPLSNEIMQEKEIALAIATKLGHYLTHNLANVTISYTRTTDIYPTLDERVDKANGEGFDYMISIHVNGSDNPEIHGTETHIHDFSSEKSYQWALLIEDQFKNRAGRKSRGVKTGADLGHSLQILKFTAMPTVLVECGFITNAAEAAYLNSVYGQELIASAIFRATREMLKANHPDINFTIPDPELVALVPDQPYYKVQIMASIDTIALTIPEFKQLSYSVERSFTEGTSMYKYKYYVGAFTDKKEAKKVQKELQDSGFPDAFLVYFE